MNERKPRRSSNKGRVTMQHVAKLAGVTMMTVSRTFRSPQDVSPTVRERVETVARALNYVPNRAASTLAAARSYTIIVLIPSITNIVFIDTISAINTVLHPRGYQMLIGITGYSSDEEQRLLSTYLAFQPDGFLVTGSGELPESRKLLSNFPCPVVHMMDLGEQSGDRYWVGFSQFEAGQTIAQHLITRGYRKIGFIAAQLDPRTLARGAGFRAELTAADLYNPSRELMVSTTSSIQLGADLLDRMLEHSPDCDALFFCNDDLAQGALFRCYHRGIKVPSDLAIVGFNDLPISAWSIPALTTIATPRSAIGTRAAEMLLDLIDGIQPTITRVDLGYELKVREST